MNSFSRILRKKRENDDNNGYKHGRLYSTISSISIAGVFIAIALIVLIMFKFINMSSFWVGIIGTILIVCLGFMTSLYWVQKIEQDKFKKTSIVFLALTVFAVVLWAISLWIGVSIFNDLINDSGKTIDDFRGSLLFVKITLIFSIQFLVASFIGTGITKYGKSRYVFQAIGYLSYLFIDFYVTYLIACIGFKDGTIVINEGISLLGNKVVLMFFILAILYAMVVNSIIKKIEQRRMRNLADRDEPVKRTQEVSTVDADARDSQENRLKKLKDMFDKNLITKEEYDKKKDEILKDL